MEFISIIYSIIYIMRFEQAIQTFSGQPLTQQILMDLLKEYRWPHNKISELVKQDLLTPVKRGLYVTGPQLNLPQPSPLLLANHLYGPSYVSLETALSYWGLIPEKVSAIFSMTTGSTKTFRTPPGRFTYTHATLPYYSFGLRQVVPAERQTVLMASKEKALCDKIITTKGLLLRSIQQTTHFLVEDLRIERSSLRELDARSIRSWINHAPKKSSLSMLVKTLDSL